MILGTAGHIDHGKTRLVHALTGVDTDRLPEERRRGITIELGFAPLLLPGVGTIGVVDVPGHEGFVRTMLAGAAGVDIALLVVAADEGVMPQTREHLSILQILGVSTLVIALTKCDLVDNEWLELASDDVRSLLAGTPYEAASVVPVAAATGHGLPDLRAALAAAASSLPLRGQDDLFRMPVDRAFTVTGTGTVATGTVWSGTVAHDQTVRIWPGGRTARVRAIQLHNSSAASAGPGQRAAVALAGVDIGAVHRGALLTGGAGWEPSSILRADVRLVATAATFGPRTRLRLHVGTSDVGARIVAAGGAIQPGEVRSARIVLDEPIVVRGGDRFVLRRLSPATTIGGGVVTDPLPRHRRARGWPGIGLSPRERLVLLLAEAGGEGVMAASLAVRLGVPPSAVLELLDQSAPSAPQGAERVFSGDALEHTIAELVASVDQFHAAHPLHPGAPLQSLRAASHAHNELVALAIGQATSRQLLDRDGALISKTGRRAALGAGEQKIRDRILSILLEAGSEPPAVDELRAALGDVVHDLLRFMEREGSACQVAPDRYWATAELDKLLGSLQAGMQPGRVYPPADLRDILGISRKFLIPVLEYADRTGLTERRDQGRVLSQRAVLGRTNLS